MQCLEQAERPVGDELQAGKHRSWLLGAFLQDWLIADAANPNGMVTCQTTSSCFDGFTMPAAAPRRHAKLTG